MSKLILLDYGHGGEDPGAIYKGRKEKDDNFKLGLAISNILRNHGVLVDETRTIDKTVSLKERSNAENRKKYDYFISIHRNAFKPEEAHGAETFTYISQSEKAKSLAGKLQKALVNVGFRDRGVKKANFHVLRETKAPAILMEVGFIDNTGDNEIFDNNFEKLVMELSRGILEELGLEFKEDIPQINALYRVMVGSYSKKENADAQVERLKKAGFDAVIMPYKS